jgi:hypothetical protein
MKVKYLLPQNDFAGTLQVKDKQGNPVEVGEISWTPFFDYVPSPILSLLVVDDANNDEVIDRAVLMCNNKRGRLSMARNTTKAAKGKAAEPESEDDDV